VIIEWTRHFTLSFKVWIEFAVIASVELVDTVCIHKATPFFTRVLIIGSVPFQPWTITPGNTVHRFFYLQLHFPYALVDTVGFIYYSFAFFFKFQRNYTISVFLNEFFNLFNFDLCIWTFLVKKENIYYSSPFSRNWMIIE